MEYMHHADAHDAKGFSIPEPWGDQDVYADFSEEYCGGPEGQLQAARAWAQAEFARTPRAMTVSVSLYSREGRAPWKYSRHVETIERTDPVES